MHLMLRSISQDLQEDINAVSTREELARTPFNFLFEISESTLACSRCSASLRLCKGILMCVNMKKIISGL